MNTHPSRTEAPRSGPARHLRDAQTSLLLLNSLSGHVSAVLVQDYLGRTALAIGFEGKLGVDDFVEVIPIALGKHLKTGLAGGLHKEVVTLTCEVRTKVGASW